MVSEGLQDSNMGIQNRSVENFSFIIWSTIIVDGAHNVTGRMKRESLPFMRETKFANKVSESKVSCREVPLQSSLIRYERRHDQPIRRQDCSIWTIVQSFLDHSVEKYARDSRPLKHKTKCTNWWKNNVIRISTVSRFLQGTHDTCRVLETYDRDQNDTLWPSWSCSRRLNRGRNIFREGRVLWNGKFFFDDTNTFVGPHLVAVY
jgi:hypothetical protein